MLISRQAPAQEFQGGLFAGINTSQITGDDLAGYNKLSATAGFFGRRTFDEKWTFMMEMGYLGKGSRKNFNPSDSIPTFYLLRLHYVEVPLLAQYAITPKLTIETGPSLGALFGWYEEDTFGELGSPNTPREQFKRFDLSWTVGALWWFSDKWALSVRNANTMFPVRDHDQKSTYRLNKGQYSSSIMGRIIYVF